jgi:hypothetical protein
MKRVLLLMILATSALIAQPQSDVPSNMSFQGLLTDTEGIAYDDGEYQLTFRLIREMNNGTEQTVWEESHLTNVSNGVFSVVLGSENPLPLNISPNVLLETQVGDEILSPRQPLTSVPFALKSSRSQQAFQSVLSDTANFAHNIPTAILQQIENLSQDSDSIFTLIESNIADSIFIYDTLVIRDSLYIFTYDTVYLTYPEALIDSLMAVILNQQTVMDSLDASQQAYIDSLYNTQQATLEALANSSLNAGFVETEVYSGSIPNSWTDLDLSSVVGQNTSLVMLKLFSNEATNGARLIFRTNGTDYETGQYADGSFGFSGGYNSINWTYLSDTHSSGYLFILTDNNGIIEYQAWENAFPNASISVVFYLNQ